jgi:signal transduction histidine kinase
MLRRASSVPWLTLCVLGIATAFVVHTMFSRKVTADIDDYVRSITQGSAAEVVELATVTEAVRLVSLHAMLARGDSVAQERAAIESQIAQMDRAIAACRLVEDDPAGHQRLLEIESRRGPFLAAVESALVTAADTTTTDPAAARATALARVKLTTDDLASSVRRLTEMNANEVSSEAAAINTIRARATTIFMALRVSIVALALTGIWLSWAASRQHVALVERNQRLAEARAKELEMFAGRVAHDLRGPLSVIEMRSTAGARLENIDAVKASLDGIRKQGQRMNEIIDALLAFAQAGAVPEPAACTNLVEIAREVIADIQSTAPAVGIEYVLEPFPSAGVACSSRVLEIVLSNLVTNASKYIGEGRAGVRRVTVRARDQNDVLHFEVEDTGPGLPRGEERAVFEPFVRLSRGSGTGVGLGLATVKRLVDAHGGSVGVESFPGSGCSFWFELPKVSALPVEGKSEPTPSTPAASHV